MTAVAIISPTPIALPEIEGLRYEYFPDASSLKPGFDYVLVATKRAKLGNSLKVCCQVACLNMLVAVLILDSKSKVMEMGFDVISIKDLSINTSPKPRDILNNIYGIEIASIIKQAENLEAAHHNIAQQYNEDPAIVLMGCELAFCAKTEALYNHTVCDKLLDNKIIAVPIFLLMMYGMFWFSVVIGGSLQTQTNQITNYITALFAPKQVGIAYHLYYAVTGGIETIISFIPLLGCMYLFIAFMEKSGYMARAINMIDRLLRNIGLSGDAFVPLITGFGCNVPAINSASKIESLTQKITTIMMVPFMACGARLSVFILLSTVFFAENSAAIVFALYLSGIAVALFTSIIFSSVVFKGVHRNLDIAKPAFQPLIWPNFIELTKISISNTVAFVKSSGKMIAVLFACVYLLNTMTGDSVNTPVKDGILVRGGKFIAPIFSPIGIDAENWPAAVSILTGSIAKESVVGSVKAIYGDGEEGAQQMRAKFNGKLGVFAYLLFILLYFPCVSVFFSIAKQLNYSWALTSVMWSTIMAYTVSTGVYQVGLVLMRLSTTQSIVIILSILFILLLGINKIKGASNASAN